MRWLLNARRLREHGILGMNRRNAEFVLDGNPRRAIGLADDKLRLHELCSSLGIATPALLGSIRHINELHSLRQQLEWQQEAVVKPARGSGGRGILVLAEGGADGFRRTCGTRVSWIQLADHVTDVLCGMHSLGAEPDAAMLQERIKLHPELAAISPGGIPDVRLVIYRGVPAMAMLRLPTRVSGGRANLHQGGLGVGINLSTGIVHHAVQNGRSIRRHPDTDALLLGRPVPNWDAVVALAIRAADAVRLRYCGVDVVIDPRRGPLLLEVNARPGLAIQHANNSGLAARLDAIDRGESAGCPSRQLRPAFVA